MKTEKEKALLYRLRGFRERARMTQADVAKAINMDESVVAKMERGVRHISVLELLAMADAYQVPASLLLGEAPYRPPKKETGGMKCFYLRRELDQAGTGTGVVAEGAVLTGGKVILHWLTEHPSIGVYDSLEEMIAIHGHHGTTFAVFDEMAPLTEEQFYAAWPPDNEKRRGKS